MIIACMRILHEILLYIFGGTNFTLVLFIFYAFKAIFKLDQFDVSLSFIASSLDDFPILLL